MHNFLSFSPGYYVIVTYYIPATIVMNHGSSERTPAFLPLLAINRRAATSLVKNVTNSNVTIYIVTFSIYFSYFFIFF